MTLDSPWPATFPFTPEPEALDALTAGTSCWKRRATPRL